MNDTDVRDIFATVLSDPQPDRVDVDAAVLGGRRIRTRRNRRRVLLVGGAVAAMLGVAAMALVGHSHYVTVIEPSGSMDPTIHIGDSVVLDKALRPQRGDVVEIALPDSSTMTLRRIVGLPGDIVSCPAAASGRCDAVEINGKPLTDPYLGRLAGKPFSPVAVTAGNTFVLGDNSSNAVDSRVAGLFALSTVSGVAIQISTLGEAPRPVPGAPAHPMDGAQVDPADVVPPASVSRPLP